MQYPVIAWFKHTDNTIMGIILALDAGTTSTRAIAFSSVGDMLHVTQKKTPCHRPKPEWVEQCPTQLLAASMHCLTNTIHAMANQTIAAIGITNQRETAIMWHRKSGMAIGPAISWQCNRTAQFCSELSAYATAIHKKTGVPLTPYFSASKWHWLMQTYPESRTLAQRGDLCLGTVDSWLLWHLTNGQVHATDATNASRTMLYNIHTMAFDSDLCDIFNIPLSALPVVHNTCHPFGALTMDGHTIPITAIVGDQQSALYAQCATNTSSIKCTYGTGLFMMANTGSTCANSTQLVNTIALQLNGTVSYAVEASILTGGSLIEWLQQQIGIAQSPADIEALASSVPDSGGVVMVPALSGLGAPHWRPDATGIILGLTTHSTKAHIARAALCAIAHQVNDCLQTMPTTQSEHKNSLRVDGGMTHNQWLMQYQANISNMAIQRAPVQEATAWGAALLAAHAIGSWSHRPPSEPPIQPKMTNLERSQAMSQWQTAMSQCLQSTATYSPNPPK